MSTVAQVMPPAGDASLKERMEIFRGLERHMNEEDYDRADWDKLTGDYAYLREKAGSDFTRLGGLYVDMLDANKEEKWSDSYRAGLDFIAATLKDSPADFNVFKDLVEKQYGIMTAKAIYDTLPGPVKGGDYEARADLFKGDN
jgi:hypothetical protein